MKGVFLFILVFLSVSLQVTANEKCYVDNLSWETENQKHCIHSAIVRDPGTAFLLHQNFHPSLGESDDENFDYIPDVKFFIDEKFKIPLPGMQISMEFFNLRSTRFTVNDVNDVLNHGMVIYARSYLKKYTGGVLSEEYKSKPLKIFIGLHDSLITRPKIHIDVISPSERIVKIYADHYGKNLELYQLQVLMGDGSSVKLYQGPGQRTNGPHEPVIYQYPPGNIDISFSLRIVRISDFDFTDFSVLIHGEERGVGKNDTTYYNVSFKSNGDITATGIGEHARNDFSVIPISIFRNRDVLGRISN